MLGTPAPTYDYACIPVGCIALEHSARCFTARGCRSICKCVSRRSCSLCSVYFALIFFCYYKKEMLLQKEHFYEISSLDIYWMLFLQCSTSDCILHKNFHCNILNLHLLVPPYKDNRYIGS